MQASRVLLLAAIALWLAPASRAEQIQRIDAEATGQALAVDASGMIAYVADAERNFVTAVEQTGRTTRFPVGPNPRWIASNGDVYTSNSGDGSVTIIAGGFQAPVNVAIGGSGPIIAGLYGGTPGRSKAYVVRQEKRDLAVVDAATRTFHPIDAGGRLTTALLGDGANRLYAAQPDAGIVRVIDISSDSSTPPATDVTVPGHPALIALDPSRNKLYALTGDAATPLVQVDLSSFQVSALSLAGHAGTPRSLSATRGQVYIGFANEFVILDLTTGNVRGYPMNGVVRVWADSTSGNAYALDAGGQLISDNNFTQRITLTQLPAPAYDMAFIYKQSRVYAATGQGLVEVDSPSGDLVFTSNAQGLWWVANGAESGWGLNITHQDATLFATWFTYDAQGRPTWLVMSQGLDSARNSYSGTLYRTSGPPFNATPFDPSKVTRTAVGTLSIRMIDYDDATMTATVDGVTVTKQLGKQIFALPEVSCTWRYNGTPSIVNYTDLWWASPAGSESGWGLNISHQGDILFITWFTYDGSGQPMWYVGSDIAKTGNGTYSGTLYTTTGPPLAASPWDPSKVTRMPAGSATLTFSDDSNGTFTYTVGGVTQSKPITRQVYGGSTTRCQ